MNTKEKIVSKVQKTAKGIRLYFFQDKGDPKQVIMETGVKQCLLESHRYVEIIYSNPKYLYPIGIIGQACASCKFKPGNVEGGCRAYYIK